MASAVFFVALIAAFVLAIGANSISTNEDEPIGQYIPPRCLEKSITPVSCAVEYSTNATLLPHPDDCQLFYYCVSPDQPPICLQCPANLYYNRKERVCDYPQNAGC